MRAPTDQLESGAITSEHEQLFRHFPRLHDDGIVVRSIAPTAMAGDHGPVYALTLLRRNASGGMNPFLAFASAPCDGGDLALRSEPSALGGDDAAIRYVTRVPIVGAPLTELQLDVSEGPLRLGALRSPRIRSRSVVVGTVAGAPGVIGSIELDAALPPSAEGIKRDDVHVFGSGWYALGAGAAYLLVHHAVYDHGDMCRVKLKARPASPPLLRLAARIDGARAFTSDPSRVGVAYVLGIGENQPPEKLAKDPEQTCRTGPTAIDDTYFLRGAPAQWLFGLFDSASAASARARALGYASGTVYATEPPAGAAPVKEPWTIGVRPLPRIGSIECDFL